MVIDWELVCTNPITGQNIISASGSITVDTGVAAWSIANIDLDDTVEDEQTGVIIAITGTVEASGKKVFFEQGGNFVEQTVTAEDTSSATITVTYGGLLSAGAATLYVRNPL